MWQPISAIDRRVAGVLVEKAKTTPDQYPMTVNAIVVGANQKTNRYPLMNLEADDVIESLDRLRSVGAVLEVQGSGRTSKYRHMMYEWLGVEKVELSVMAELLLRGAQTEGELRGRAARMDPIADLPALRPILESLAAKNLIISLSPPGRGHVLTHALYQPQELEKVRREFHAEAFDSAGTAEPIQSSATIGGGSTRVPPAVPAVSSSGAAIAETIEGVGQDVSALRAEMAQLRRELEELTERQRRTEEELQQMRTALGG